MLQLCYDEAIPLVPQLFSHAFTLTPFQGCQVDARCVKDADVLLVRSVTPVCEELLHLNRGLRLVGSVTSGIDHMDRHYLHDRGIACIHAPGANAESVVNYVLTALLLCYADHLDQHALEHFSLAVIGYGAIGRQVYRCAQALGLRVMACDPFKEQGEQAEQQTEDRQTVRFVALEQALQADVISLHVPLTQSRQSAFPTYHLLNRQCLLRIKPGSLLINTSRGAVVDNQALADLYMQGLSLQSVIDVWEHEPHINSRLLHHASIATPHIAGHSLHGKTHGIMMIWQHIQQHFALPAVAMHGQDYRYALDIRPAADDYFRPYHVMAQLLDQYLCRLSACSQLLKTHPDTFSLQRSTYPLRYDFSQVDFRIQEVPSAPSCGLTRFAQIAWALGLHPGCSAS